ncbi:MAG TPA: TonB family protein [Pyrinomonadaceae bacterium]|nr:TonB family protein [Pyrinomonadaceae bacterium]
MSLCLIVLALSATTRAQTAPAPNEAAGKIERARSLAVVGNFTAAASELEALLTATNDDAVRDVARILLMSVYLKQSNYPRADAVLDESFKARTAGNENSTRVYFALAGQLINGVRSRLDRYREFGLNPASDELTTDARNDIEQLRVLLERVVEQARTIRDANAQSNARTGSTDAVALFEDAATVRLTLARGGGERARWQREIAEARQYLLTAQTRRGNVMPAVAKRPAAVTNTTPANNQATGAVAAAATPQATPTVEQSSASAARSIGAGETSSAPAPSATPAPNAPPPPARTPATGGAQQQKSADGGTTAGPVAVGSLLDKATQRVAPAYPVMARNMGVAGVVTVFVVVNEKGQVETVERASGPSLLQRPATDAARRWRFRPTLVEGQPVRVSGYISFNFAL